MKITAVIMAGGKGERFWPKSRLSMPKQFLCLTEDGKTMLQHSVDRVKGLVALEDIFIVTNSSYEKLVLEQVPEIPKNNILFEPISKNTAPCIGLAAMQIKYRYKEAVMLVLSSDHLIRNSELFKDTLKNAVKIAEKEKNIVTIGIAPSYPEIGYGYIRFGEKKEEINDSTYEVIEFVEKPNLETAKEYIASGQYLWNSGMFVWKVSTILHNFEMLIPNIYRGLMNIFEAFDTEVQEEIIKREFSMFEPLSIDYGIMEKAESIFTIPGNFGWDDVGSWLALERINKTDAEGNLISGNIVAFDAKNCIIQAENKLVATIGIQNLIVVDTKDVLLICSKESNQDIKQIIDHLKETNRDDYL